MLNKRVLAAFFSLTLAGSMTLPAFAINTTIYEMKSELKPVISDYTPVISDENPLTRAELVSVLHNKEGKPYVNFAMNYDDIASDTEYAEAIRWASSEKIVNGYGNGNFGPNDFVTREQLSVILYRYAQSKEQGFTGNWAFPLDYSDAKEISDFAYEAVCWLTMKNIIGDTQDNLFAPKTQITHKDANQIFEQYFKVIDAI